MFVLYGRLYFALGYFMGEKARGLAGLRTFAWQA
jgi:hypothetical protein